MLTLRPRPHPAIIVSILAALSGCHGAPPSAPIPTVSSGTVSAQTDYLGERYSTSINPNAEVQLMFKSAGIVNYIRTVRGGGRLITAGDPIVAGEELARVRTTEYEAQLHQQQSQVAQADAQLAAAQAAETQARLNYDRANVLFSQASLTKPNYDQARSSYDQAVASVQQAKAAGATARAAVAQVEVTVGDTAVRAPFNGSIVQRNIDIGDLGGPSSAAFTVIDTHVVKAVFSVPESALSSVRLGQRLDVALDNLSRAVSGYVTSIAPAADPKSRVFTIEVTIPNPHHAILPGAVGSVALTPAAMPSNRVLVPLSAVVQSPNTPHGLAVLLLEERDGKAYVHARDFIAGNTYGDSVEVKSGLSPGQHIVTLGAQLVHDGQEVRILKSE
ncbi:MAG TPA: efflux RND transporter periplasmic adaptor subunit [Edaphobacter sp.]